MPSTPEELTKLRISAHQLYVETGRYCNPVIPRENKFCFHCKNIVEDEKHFLLDCPLYLSLIHISEPTRPLYIP